MSEGSDLMHSTFLEKLRMIVSQEAWAYIHLLSSRKNNSCIASSARAGIFTCHLVYEDIGDDVTSMFRWNHIGRVFNTKILGVLY